MTTIVETHPEVKPPASIAYRFLECGDYFLYHGTIYQLCEGHLCFNVTTGKAAAFDNVSYVLPIKRLTITYTT